MQILNIQISNISFAQTLEKIEHYLNFDSSHYIVTPNPEIILAAQKDSELKEILNKANLALPDGVGLKLASKFKIKQRITGTDVMMEILEKHKNKKYKFVINEKGLSSKEEILNKADVQVDEESPDIVFIGLGCPEQEKWIKNNINKYSSAKVFMTVGGGFDFLTGKQTRAPKWMRNAGLEWLWRLFKQPNRIKRIFRATVVFPLKVLLSS